MELKLFGFAIGRTRIDRLIRRTVTNQVWKNSPMTYMFDNKQYVVMAVGTDIVAFGLP